MIGGMIGKAIGEPHPLGTESAARTIIDTLTYMNKPVDVQLADEWPPKLMPSKCGGVPLMKSIFGED